MDLPCRHLRAVSSTSKREESTITGTREISGSEAIRFRKCFISARASSIASSIFTSSTIAPSRTCAAAISRASLQFFSLIRRRNFLLPATLHLSPTFMNIPLFQKASMPDSQGVCSEGISRGEAPSTTCAMAAICSGVVPQQPPSIFTSLFSMKGLTALAIVAGSWSYLPKASGIPALGWALV